MLVENIEKPILIELEQVPHSENYVVFLKNNLRGKLPPALFNKLARNGLYSTIENGIKEDDTRFGLNRLIACLYQNILGLQVHHIDKKLHWNDVTSIVPIDKDKHNWIHSLLNGEDIVESRKLQAEQKNKIFKRRHTLASNNDLVFELIKMKSQNMKPKEIIKLLKGKLKKSTIYANIKYFFYPNEFLKWIIGKKNITLPPLDGKFNERWQKILEFDNL